MREAKPTGLFTRWELGCDFGQCEPRQRKTRIFQKTVKSFFQKTIKGREILLEEHIQKTDDFTFDVFLPTATLCWKLSDGFIKIVTVKKFFLFSLARKSSKFKKIELDELRKQ